VPREQHVETLPSASPGRSSPCDQRRKSFGYPDYMPKGEIRVEDPDGYCLLVGQAG